MYFFASGSAMLCSGCVGIQVRGNPARAAQNLAARPAETHDLVAIDDLFEVRLFGGHGPLDDRVGSWRVPTRIFMRKRSSWASGSG
jgi:hypothetical protein